MAGPGSPDVRYARLQSGAAVAFETHGAGVTVVKMPSSLISTPWAPLPMGIRQRAPGARVIVYSHLGSGMSDREDYDFSMEGFAAELDAVVADAVTGTFILVAQSASAPSAIQYAATHPDRISALVLYRAWLRGSDYVSTATFSAYRKSLEGDWLVGSETYAALVLGLSGAERRGAAAQVRQLAEQSTYSTFLDEIADHDASSVAASLTVPVHVIGITDDLLTPEAMSRALARSIPGAHLELVDGIPAANDRASTIVRTLVDAVSEQPRAGEGVQTILFTDLAGSTAMQARLGDEGALEVLHAHDATVRQAIGEFNGREVKHTGDGMMTVFGSAADAVNCALTVRREIATYNDTHEGEELLVRFGINAGEPIAEDDDLFGLSVTLAARIGDWGEPGQVLCSRVVRDLLLGKGFEFTSVGDAELKGLDEPVALHEVNDA